MGQFRGENAVHNRQLLRIKINQSNAHFEVKLQRIRYLLPPTTPLTSLNISVIWIHMSALTMLDETLLS